MKMHEQETLAHYENDKTPFGTLLPTLARIRVPGGWIYITYQYSQGTYGGIDTSASSTFVPYSPETLE